MAIVNYLNTNWTVFALVAFFGLSACAVAGDTMSYPTSVLTDCLTNDCEDGFVRVSYKILNGRATEVEIVESSLGNHYEEYTRMVMKYVSSDRPDGTIVVSRIDYDFENCASEECLQDSVITKITWLHEKIYSKTREDIVSERKVR